MPLKPLKPATSTQLTTANVVSFIIVSVIDLGLVLVDGDSGRKEENARRVLSAVSTAANNIQIGKIILHLFLL